MNWKGDAVTPAIQISNLSVYYTSTPAISDVSLTIEAGELVLVTGPSGCGKSTLARAITGLIPHAIPARLEGSIWVAGLATHQHSLPEIARVAGAVFQNPNTQLFHLKVEDEVAFGPNNLGLDATEVRRRVNWALKATGLSELRQANPAILSRGQQQRLAIAAAIAMLPQVLVLDEPTSSLDIPGVNAVMSTLRNLQRETGMTLVIIEHRLAEILPSASRLVLMDEGRIIANGNAQQLLEDRQLRFQFGLRRPVDKPLASWESLLIPNGECPENEPPLLELENVHAGYDGRSVLSDINLKLHRGEFAALVGDNGAGKSTLGLVIAGLLKPQQGKVSFNTGKKRPRPGLDVAMLFQNPTDQLFTDSVAEEVAYGAKNYDIFDQETYLKTLNEADLLALRDKPPLTLSIGQQQRTALAACLILRPSLLILDEPTLGQDWGHLQRLMDYLTYLNQNGTAILLISHDYKLIHRYARRVILLESGRVVLDGHNRHSEHSERT